MLNLANFSSSCFCGCAIDQPTNRTLLKCSSCPRIFHKVCLRLKSQPQKYKCFACYLHEMNPLRPVTKCLFLGFFTNKRELAKFTIAKELAENREYSVELRSARIEESPVEEITWPDSCEVLVNRKVVGSFKPLGKSSSVKRRRDAPKVLSQARLEIENTLRIRALDYQKDSFKISSSPHLIGLYLVSSLTQDQLAASLLSSTPPIQSSLLHLKNYLLTNTQDLCIRQSQISLICPYSSCRIRIPARGQNCKHLACFDLSAIIWANIKFPRWKCPICKLSCYRLRVDGLLEGILRGNRRVKAVKFKGQNGEYEVREEEEGEERDGLEGEEPPMRKVVRGNEIDISEGEEGEQDAEEQEPEQAQEDTQQNQTENRPHNPSRSEQQLERQPERPFAGMEKLDKKKQQLFLQKLSVVSTQSPLQDNHFQILSTGSREQPQPNGDDDQLLVIDKDQFEKNTINHRDYYKKHLRTVYNKRFMYNKPITQVQKTNLVRLSSRALCGAECPSDPQQLLT